MPCEYSGPTAWQLLQSTSSSSQSSSRSSCTLQAHGGASRRPTTENDYKLSFAVASILAFVNTEQHHETVEELVEEADDKLFTYVMYNKQHVLHSSLHGTMDT